MHKEKNNIYNHVWLRELKKRLDSLQSAWHKAEKFNTLDVMEQI